MKEPINLEPLFPDRNSAEPLGHQLARRLRTAIETGALTASTRVLPSRELAHRLGLARNTVTFAINQLVAEGYLEARKGSGTFVAQTPCIPRSAVSRSTRKLPGSAGRALALRPAIDLYSSQSGALRSGSPDFNVFPVAVWQRLMRANLSSFARYADYGDMLGYYPLREAIAQHVRQFRGITADARRTIVVEGTQGALALIADVLAATGDSVLLEDPCYPLARALFELKMLRIEPARVDDEGIRTETAPSATLAYVTPSHQFPLGGTMSLERRSSLLAWAAEHDAYVIEDDYDSEYYYGARPLPSLQTIDRNERVIYVSSFSKTLFPGLRMAYIIVPEHLLPAFATARALLSLGGCRFLQATLADFIGEGHFARHVRHTLVQYDVRRKALIAVLQESGLTESFAMGPSSAGLHLTIRALEGCDDVAIARAMQGDVRVQPLSKYCIARTDCEGFVLGYSARSALDIRAAVYQLAAAVQSFSH